MRPPRLVIARTDDSSTSAVTEGCQCGLMHERPSFVIDEQATFKDVAAEFDSHELYSRLGLLDDDGTEMCDNRANRQRVGWYV